MRAIYSPVDRGTRPLVPGALVAPGDAGFAAFAHPVHEIGRALSEDYGTVPVSVTRGVYKSLKTR
jgi:hypothetical protein